jgi:hypothetical protein
MAVGAWSAQSATAQESKCFSIHVRLNGKPVDGPQVITLKTNQNESTASLEDRMSVTARRSYVYDALTCPCTIAQSNTRFCPRTQWRKE